MKIQAKAKIQVQVQIVNPSFWGDDCSMEQIYNQAAKESLEQLKNLFDKYLPNGKILDEPRVTVILVDKEEK